MREITQKIYKYEELSEKAKEKAKNEYREFFQECRSDFFYRDFVEELRENGFKSLEPQYSLSHCQGDGCSVVGKIYLEEILNNEEIMENFDKDWNIQTAKWRMKLKQNTTAIITTMQIL